jgi:PAS domain S-box-containing protein
MRRNNVLRRLLYRLLLQSQDLGTRLLLMMVGGAVVLAGLLSAVTATALFDARNEALSTAARGLELQGSSYLSLLVDQNTSVNNKELAANTAHGLVAAQAVSLNNQRSPVSPADLQIAQLLRLDSGALIDTRATRICNIYVPAQANPTAVAADLRNAATLDSIFLGQYKFSRHIQSLTFVGASGLVQTYPARAAWLQIPRHDQTALALFANGQHRPIWLQPYERADEGGLITTVIVPIYSDLTRLDGVIAIDVSLTFLTLNLEAMLPTSESTAFLIDNQRTLIAATPGILARLAPGLPQPLAQLPITQTITISRTVSADLDRSIDNMLQSPENLPRLTIGTDRVVIAGQPFFLAYAPILETGWVLGLLTPIDALTTRADDVSGVIVATNKTVVLSLLSSAIIFTLLAAIVSLYLTRRLTRPLIQLTSAAVAIGQGDYHQTLPVRSSDEFGRVAAAFNTMSQSIRRADQALRESEQRYRLITERTSDLIAMVDLVGRYTYVSPSYEHLLGYPPADLIRSAAIDLIHPDDQAVAQRCLTHSISTSASTQMTLRYRHSGNSWCWIDTQCMALAYGGVRYILIVGRDITERKRLEAQLLQSQKMESIGRLAGGVAHDFNNLLTAILGYADLGLDALPPDASVRADLEEIRKAADRASALTRQLLTFARKQIIAPRTINLNHLIVDMEKLLHRLIGEHIELVTRLAADLNMIRVDPGQIEQVLVNLVVNARDAMPEGGKLTIETCNIVLDQDYIRDHFDMSVGSYVLLVVSDTGIGMDETVRSHLFEPFFTTKEPGQGTGLGLATCYGIIKQHAGSIWVYSEPDQGSSFKIYLPCVLERADDPPVQIERGMLPQGHETILLVEDELAVRSLAGRLLRDLGYTVLEAINGVDALQLFQTLPNPLIDLLLTDVVMPHMGGMQLALHITELSPAVKVLYMSGYTEQGIVHHGRLYDGANLLQKPFSLVMLANRVREVLDS